MAPKKPKAQSSSSSSSQPVPEAHKPTRTSGRKRKHSDASNVSDVSQSLDTSTTSAPGKRRKRGRGAASAEPEPISEEDEVDLEGSSAPVVVVQQEVSEQYEDDDMQEAITVSQNESKHVHFDAQAATSDNFTAANITPHPSQRLTVKRRVTLSPAMGTIKRIKTTLPRSSLPSALAPDVNTSPTAIIQEMRFAPLRDALDARIRRRLRRSHLSEEQNAIEDHVKHDQRTQQELDQLRAETEEKQHRIEDLVYELEAQRHAAIEVNDETDYEREKVASMEKELAGLKQELASHMASHGFDGTSDGIDMPDNNMMVLDRQEEFSYPQLPTPEPSHNEANGTSLALSDDEDDQLLPAIHDSAVGRLSMSATVKASWDAERRKFEDAILTLSHEANDAKTRFQVLAIEVQGLGMGKEGVDSHVVMRSIRESFDRIREALDLHMPDAVPEDASTQDVLEILISSIKEFADRLRTQDEELNDKDVLIADLGNQVSGLLDHLADAELRKQALEKQWGDLDSANDEKARTLDEMEEEMAVADEELERLRNELAAKTAEASMHENDHADALKSIEALGNSLQGYYDSEKKLEAIITTMEQNMEKAAEDSAERQSALKDQVTKLETELEEAKDISAAQQTSIDGLESKIDDLSKERDDLHSQLEDTRLDLEVETDTKTALQAELDERRLEIEDLEARVDRLDEELTALNDELITLRGLNESERRQRVAAETDLDDRNIRIEELTASLHESGTQANALRQKLFEVQQTNEQKVKDVEQKVQDLEQAMSERDEQFQADIASEVTRREAADDLAQQHATTILELETHIEEIELHMKETLAERDERIAELEGEVSDKNDKIEGLKMDLRGAENQLDQERTESEDKIGELNDSINGLQDTIAEREEQVHQLEKTAIDTQTRHDSQIEDRNAEIATLHHNVLELRDQIQLLNDQKEGLERRVEEEAEQMLELQNQKEDEIEALRAAINDKQQKILIVEEKAREADSRWQEVLEARDEEIDLLKTKGAASRETISVLQSDKTTLKAMFADYVRRTSGVISNLQAAVNAVQYIADNEGESLKARGAALVDEMEAIDNGVDQETIVVQEQAAVKHSAATKAGKALATPIGHGKKGRGRKRRNMDSGIGLDDVVDEDEEMDGLIAV